MALAALKDDKTLTSSARSLMAPQSDRAMEDAVAGSGAGVFLTTAEKRESQGPSVKDMQAKIGQLALENDFSYGPSLQAGRRFPSRPATGIS